METKKQQEQANENGQFVKPKMTNAVRAAVGVAGVAAASYAYSQSQTTEIADEVADASTHKATDDNHANHTAEATTVNEVSSIENEAQSVATEQAEANAGDDIIVEAEPIASIDASISGKADEDEEIVIVGEDEIEEPYIEGDSPIDFCEEIPSPVGNVTGNEDSFIENDIQADLFA